MQQYRHPKIAGFTLIEMVTVILILGIIVVGISSFVVFGTRIFVESSAVDQVLSQSRFGIERMTRDIRRAVPNSMRVLTATDGSYQCLELLPISASTSYIDAPFFPQPVQNTLTAIKSVRSINAAQSVLIYPLTASEVYNPQGLTAKRFLVQSVAESGDLLTISLTQSIRFTEASPLKRLYVAQSPLSYCFINTAGNVDLRLYQQYGYKAVQPSPADMGNGVLMAQNITNTLTINPAIILTPATLVTNAIVHLQPRFRVNGETFQYQHQVQVMNVP
ncbi:MULTISPECIES: type II secretion system protein [Shewanella]|uniref:Type II secretion system protein n=1 Tax=Shewanella vesiculosa TaxID=518738 RepID=A0ABV0FUM1_9GAMM|nr:MULTISPECIES: type II secretion system protein [Shewanella]NCQ45077.1 type II secretion system protein [Shewanella frigidimarina]NCO70935.1 type II secretion system protein [Shewanella vesiculosa]NCP37052.1 type II secretion system protein [Shewanella vesiculosa]NCP68855.1 type II secretion system protein [Shewanella vesiculosa]NCP74389.1 type II secretion system protein [Shewanella vesiculosa]